MKEHMLRSSHHFPWCSRRFQSTHVSRFLVNPSHQNANHCGLRLDSSWDTLSPKIIACNIMPEASLEGKKINTIKSTGKRAEAQTHQVTCPRDSYIQDCNADLVTPNTITLPIKPQTKASPVIICQPVYQCQCIPPITPAPLACWHMAKADQVLDASLCDHSINEFLHSKEIKARDIVATKNPIWILPLCLLRCIF